MHADLILVEEKLVSAPLVLILSRSFVKKKAKKCNFFTDQDMIKAMLKIAPKRKGPMKRIYKINFEVHGPRIVFHLSTLIGVLRKRSQFGNQVRQNLRFLEFLKKRKMANFRSKNLCDKSSKFKNLRWQFSCIFRCLRHSVLRFFCRCRYHRDIFRSKLLFLKISKKDEKWAFLYSKIRPLEILFFAFFPPIFLAHSRGTFWTPELWWGTQNEDFQGWSPIVFDHFVEKSLFFTDQDMIKVIAQNCA